LFGATKRPDAVIRNKKGKKIKYKINRRPSRVKKLSKSGQYYEKHDTEVCKNKFKN
jgi:IS5 family transposase